jgi:uncharacterized protein
MKKLIESSMASDLFIDTSGFFALVSRRDAKHDEAQKIWRRMRAEKRNVVTTDYVLDETATLLKARGEAHLVGLLFERVFKSAATRVCWMDAAQFEVVAAFFAKHADQAWSFTDCVSFCVMKQMRLQKALTSDQHFEQAGFLALLQ